MIDQDGHLVIKIECDDDCMHLGKFQDCLSESVYDAWLEWGSGSVDSEGGDASEGPGYFALVTGYDTEGFPHPAYIIEIHNSGAVYVSAYDTEIDAVTEWEKDYQPQIEAYYAEVSW